MALTKRKAKRVAKRYWPLAVAAVAVLALAVAWMAAPASEWAESLSRKIGELGMAGPAIYVVLYILGTIILAPSPLMSIAAGLAFGWSGLPLAVVAATAGATCSLLLSRYFFNDTLEDWLTDRPTFRAATTAVNEEGWRIILLLRLSPVVPFGLLNYMLGLTKTPLLSYLIWTAVGILPGSFIDVYIGVIGANASDTPQLAYLIVGFIATAAAAILIAVKSRSYLRAEGVKV